MTPFLELDELVEDVAANATTVFGDGLVGVYIEGSFALGAGDEYSDLDFFVVSRDALIPQQEQAIRAFWDELPTRDHRWARDLEGSYAPLGELLDPAAVGRRWLFVDHGHREMEWDSHGNDLVHRWVLGTHGLAVTGPPARDVVAPVEADALRAEARHELSVLREGLLGWIDPDIAAFQRYTVVNYCRVLYTIAAGAVGSKPAALDWAIGTLDPQWRPLLTAARDERVRGWDVTDRPAPGVMDRTWQFATYCETYGQAS